MPTPYEKQRLDNIQRNREMLLALGLDELKKYVPPKATKKDVAAVAKSRKRKSPPQDAEDESESNGKVLKTRTAQSITDASGVRRSARNTGRVVDYKSEVVKTFPEAISLAAKVALASDRKNTLERRHNPYVDLSATVVIRPLTPPFNAGSNMATFPTLRSANGGRQGTLRSE